MGFDKMTDSSRPTLFRPGVGSRGMTELHYAAYRGDFNELARELDAGADPNAKDQYRVGRVSRKRHPPFAGV